MLTMLNMFRLALPGASLWYLVFDLIASPSLLIRIRGLRLLCFSFYTLDGHQQLDTKQLVAFDKLQGFSMMTDLLCQYETDERTVGLLLTLLFWRTRVVSSLLSAPGGHHKPGAYLPHMNMSDQMGLGLGSGTSAADEGPEMETLLANDDALLIDRDDEEDDEDGEGESDDDDDELVVGGVGVRSRGRSRSGGVDGDGGLDSDIDGLSLSYQEEVDLVYAAQGPRPGELGNDRTGSGTDKQKVKVNGIVSTGAVSAVEAVDMEHHVQNVDKPIKY